MLDNYNRKINYMRLSVTDRCNLRCRYCMPEAGVSKKKHHDILRHEEMVSIVQAGAKLGIEKVRLTGGEPLIRKGIVNLVSDIKKVKGIKEITMTTNGLLLEAYLDDLVKAGLSRINLSLDTLVASKYSEITRGGDLSKVLNIIPRIMSYGLKLKINVVLIGGFNDQEILDFINLTVDDDIDVRFIELMPIGQASKWNNGKFVSNQVVLESCNLSLIDNNDIGSPATYYRYGEAKGRVGLINPISCTFCDSCNRIRVTSDGKIKPCLHSNEEIDLMDLLRKNVPILPILKQAIINKPKEHEINNDGYSPIKRDMNRIGG